MDNTPKQGRSIDIKRLIFRVIKFWYVILISLIIAFVVAYLKNRYSTRIFPVNASIIIKEAQETSEGKLLYNNPLVSNYRNYLNELYIIRSHPLIKNVLEKLNFEVSFYREGSFLTTEAYNYIPVEAFVISDQSISSKKLIFKILSEKTFELQHNGDSEDKNPKVFNFNDTIDYAGLKILFRKKDINHEMTYKDVPFIFYYNQASNLTASYVGRLKAQWAEEGSGVMDLSINGHNPNKEIDFLEGLIREYQDYDLQKKNLTASRTIDFINDQLKNISDSLHKAERQLELFQNKNVMTDLSAEAVRLYAKVEGLENQKTDLVIRDNYYKYLREYINHNEDLDEVILPSSVGVSDGVLVDLVSKMIDLQRELKLIINQEKIQTFIVKEKRKLLVELKNNILEAIKNQKGVDKIKLDFLNIGINDIERQLNRLPIAERQLVSIKRNYTLLENLYLFLLQKRAEADISKASNTTGIVIVNPPMISGGAIYPKQNQNYALALFFGLFIPLSIFVLIELFNTKIQSKEDLEKLVTMPFIGGIGHKIGTNNLEVLNKPRSFIAESFRALRTNLSYFVVNNPRPIFLITSSISGEGKTFTTINLASVFALSGKKTLIVGADMRRPRLFDDFGLNNDMGLSSYLAGMSDFDNVVQRTTHECLDLISGGPVPPNPGELLLTKRMEDFIFEARKRYDCIIIDSPPLSIVADAFIIAKYVDHTLFLVRQNFTPKHLTQVAEESYRSERLKNLSVILNDIYKSGPGYGYGYGYTYGYGNGVEGYY